MNIIDDPHRVYDSIEAAAILLGVDIVKGLTTDEENELIKYQFYLSQAVESGDLSYYDKRLLKEIPIPNTEVIKRIFEYKFTGQNLIDFAKKKNIQLQTGNIRKNDDIAGLATNTLQTTIFDNNSSTYPPELDFALRAWLEVSSIESKGKPKARIRAWLDSNTKLSNEAKERISIVANWDKSGGATRTS